MTWLHPNRRFALAAFALAPMLALAGCNQLERLLGPDHEVVLEANFAELDPAPDSAIDRAELLQQSEQGIRQRLAAIYVDVLSFEVVDERIEMVVSGARNSSRLNRLLATRGEVEVRMVDEDADPEQVAQGIAPPGRLIVPMADETGSLVVHRLGGLTGPRAIEARATRDEETFEPILMIRFDPDNRRRFEVFAPTNEKHPAAIILDGHVLATVMVPVWPIADEEVRISAGPTDDIAQDLALVLNQDPLPVSFEITHFEAIP